MLLILKYFQFPGLQDNPFLQHSREHQARFQYPPTLQQEPEKNSQETEQERPRMHNGKKVNNITENISIFSKFLKFQKINIKIFL